MNNKIKLAVAGAVLSAASIANAGIVIPAGDWTLDVNGNVNAFATFSRHDNEGAITGDLQGAYGTGSASNTGSEGSTQAIGTGLLPAWLGFTGTTRQNDVDVSFTISMQPNVSDNGATGDKGSRGQHELWRQAFLTFGDKSWGTVKLGKDLGIYSGQAILNDMTLLGVGGGFRNSGSDTTLGGIGSGYIYPAWKGQFAYTTPNMNGFQATIGLVNPNMIDRDGLTGSSADQTGFGVEGEVQYSWTGDVAGKIWASTAQYRNVKDNNFTASRAAGTYDVQMYDIGATVSSGNFGLTGYYYDGEGGGSGVLGFYGADANGKERDSNGGYLQATYVIPTGTKLGVAYGTTRLDDNTADAGTALMKEQNRWTVGAYHPLTKHLNLVAEFNDIEVEAHNSSIENDAQAISLGAILFF